MPGRTFSLLRQGAMGRDKLPQPRHEEPWLRLDSAKDRPVSCHHEPET
jgi:hypothetical protein